MSEYLDFRRAQCKDCYRCLRECPVKAIDVHDHQAKIIADRCILCGHCILVCPQNAKVVHTELDAVKAMLQGPVPVVASVAPSFIASFPVEGFAPFALALQSLGFAYAEETAAGAQAVTQEYRKLLESGQYPNLIASACPALCKAVQLYYPEALPYLAPVDSPMIAHCKMLKARFPEAKVVFLGPCIAKKREAAESGCVDGVLTFEELREWLEQSGLDRDWQEQPCTDTSCIYSPHTKQNPQASPWGAARYYPVRRGIIQSFDRAVPGYEFMSVDGADNCIETLRSLDGLKGFFLEMNICNGACINGPCSLNPKGKQVAAMARVRAYARKQMEAEAPRADEAPAAKPQTEAVKPPLSFARAYPHLDNTTRQPTEAQLQEILRRTGKYSPEDELNCGACGYVSCRQKAKAVFNGYVDIDVCIPYMRERAESMSYEVIHGSPFGIVVMDSDLRLMDMNLAARRILGVAVTEEVRQRPADELMDATHFMLAQTQHSNKTLQKLFIPKTGIYINQTISILKDKNILFSVLTDITEEVKHHGRLAQVKRDTLEVTDQVVKKQMRVAQEIASLLGETTAETKVALLQLKQMLQQEEDDR